MQLFNACAYASWKSSKASGSNCEPHSPDAPHLEALGSLLLKLWCRLQVFVWVALLHDLLVGFPSILQTGHSKLQSKATGYSRELSEAG
jgi:hypothetical protein